MRDESLRALDADRADTKEKTEYLKMNSTKEAAKLRKRVTGGLKPGLSYQERMFHFKHTDANRISDAIRKSCTHELSLGEHLNPQFQVCVDIERLPGQICPVRVLIIVVTGTPQK